MLQDPNPRHGLPPERRGGVTRAGLDLVIFDCDGVVVDSELIASDVLARVLSRHAFPADPRLVLDRYLGRAFGVVSLDFERTLGRPIPPAVPLEFRRELEEAFRAGLQPVGGIAAVLSHFTTSGVPFALASSSSQARIAHALDLTGLSDYFSGRIFDAAMVAHGKPAPDLFLYVAAQFEADPERVLVVEDSPAGVTAGKAAGMTVWGFTGGAHHASFDGASILLQAGADRLIDTMAALLTI